MGGGASKRKYSSECGEDDNVKAAVEESEKYGAVTLSGGDVVRQKVSIHHVVNEVFYCAPVKVKAEAYPKSSKLRGEQYIWIELNDRAIDEQERQRLAEQTGSAGQDADASWEKHKQSFPPGVSVDKSGNIKIASRGEGMPIEILSDDVMASFSLPKQPGPPFASSKHAECIGLKWNHVLGLVDQFEVYYRVANPQEDDLPWECLQCKTENTQSMQHCASCGCTNKEHALDHLDRRYKTAQVWESLGLASAKDKGEFPVTGIQCGVPYVFRIRAHNRMGWGPFSEKSVIVKTLPEPPEKPDAPYFQNGCLRPDRVLLQWNCPKANGRHVSSFEVHGGAIKDEKVALVYTGQNLFAVLSNLTPESSYHYKVLAVNEIGSSLFSEYVTFRTPPDGKKKSQQAETEKKVSPCEWAEVFDYMLNRTCYVNIRSEQVVYERPAEMDGPVDPILLFKQKRFRFNRVLLKDVPKGAGEIVRLNIRKDFLLWDSFYQLMHIPCEDLKKRVKIDYVGEEGIDAGGLGKDWFLELSRQLFDPSSGLFAKLGEGEERDIKMHAPGPDPVDGTTNNNSPEMVRSWYYFVGRFLGKAIIDRQLVDVHLSATLFKQIFGMHVDIDDLRQSDPTLVKSMEWMLENDIDDILFEEFCVTVDPPPGSSSKEKMIIDLKPGGRNIEVTDENKEEYVELMLKWRAIDSCKEPIEAIRQGLFEVIPEACLKAADFHLKELDMLWNGLPIIDVQTIRNTCVYQGGFDANHPIVHWFWKIFKDFDEKEKALLLRFATGTSKVPVDGLDPPLNLTFNSDLDPGSLCKAHSCFNQLVFPEYVSEEIMRDKILYAIANTDGFLLG